MTLSVYHTATRLLLYFCLQSGRFEVGLIQWFAVKSAADSSTYVFIGTFIIQADVFDVYGGFKPVFLSEIIRHNHSVTNKLRMHTRDMH